MTSQLEIPCLAPTPARKPYSAAEFRVLRLRELPLDAPLCDEPQRVYDFWIAHVMPAAWYNPDAECLVVILLNTRRRIQGFSLVSIGTLDTILVHPREVFRTAIVNAAASIILAHQHPSGDPTPSEADVRVTRDLIRAGQLLRIELADHVVIGRPLPDFAHPYTSLRTLGYFAL